MFVGDFAKARSRSFRTAKRLGNNPTSPGFRATVLGPVGLTFDVADAPGAESLFGLGNVVYGNLASHASQMVAGGCGLTTIVLGDGNNVIKLGGAFNTVVLGDGNNIVDLGAGRASVRLRPDAVEVDYRGLFRASFSAPGLSIRGGAGGDNIGWFNAGRGNIGAFNGFGNASPTSGNDNVGAFNGFGNGGHDNGNQNIGAFNGVLNGVGTISPTSGSWNGAGNVGAFNGDFNGAFVSGLNSGNGNGNGNIGFLSGDGNGDGDPPTPRSVFSATSAYYEELIGGFDTAVLGDGDNVVKALAGFSTILTGDGSNWITIGGRYNTVVAGDGRDCISGADVACSLITLGDGGDVVRLTGDGDTVITGSGDDYVSVTGCGNRIDAGAAQTFNEIHLAGACETIVVGPGAGYDEIFGFASRSGDKLDLSQFEAPDAWDGSFSDLSNWFATVNSGCGTLLQARGSDGQLQTVAELIGVRANLASLSRCIVC